MDAWFASVCMQHILHYPNQVVAEWYYLKMQDNCNLCDTNHDRVNSMPGGNETILSHVHNSMQELLTKHGEEEVLSQIGGLSGCCTGVLCNRCADGIQDTWLLGMRHMHHQTNTKTHRSYADMIQKVVYA